MSQLSLTLFGSFAAAAAGQSLRLPTDKTRALLAYLALTPDTPLRRESLAGLLWPEQPEAQARQNLRKTAGRLKQALDELVPGLGSRLLALTKQTIEFQSAGCTVDALTFRALVETARRHPHPSLAQCPACLAGLETAAGLYRPGELLAGLSLPDAAPFEEWLLMQRENLHQQQLAALHRLADAYEQAGLLEKAQQFAQWQIQHEPWREEAHRQLMSVLAAQGRRAEAIAQYQACRRTLQAELGVAPAAETEALLTRIMDGSHPVAAAQTNAARAQAWPRVAGPLIGRETELAQIAGLLAEPGCRVLTVTGLGGIGKTSVAIATGEALAQAPPAWLPDGAYLVPLAEINNSSRLPAAVAAAVGLALNERQEIAAQVEHFLRPKALLLVLDNFEQLAPEAGWLQRLSAAAPRLKLLVTSREPLNWQEEWLYPLEGLAYPPDGAGGSEFDAVALFVQAARQAQPGFVYTDENGAAIARICRTVHGWPLALRMAAAWVRMMSCQAIADQISRSLDLLTTSLRDLPPRQRSLRAIFEHTWEALSAEEQGILEQLAVFRGGFTLAAAVEAAGASPLALRGLVDRALVQHDERSGRCLMHDLLRQFALDHTPAGPDRQRAARQIHSRYYLRLLESEAERLYTTQFEAALDVIKADLGNLRQAWLWAAREAQYAALADHLGHLAKFYESSGPPQEAAAFFRRTIAVLEGGATQGAADLTAQLHFHLAESLIRMGQYGEATATVIAAQGLAQALDDAALINQLFITQAHIFREQGRYEQSHAVLQEAIVFSRARQDLPGVARALQVQGNTHWSMAAYAQARQCYEEARQIYEQLGQAPAVAVLTGNIGAVLWRLGQCHAALENYQVALDAVRAVGDASRVPVWLGNIGLVYVDLGEDERAMAYLDEAVTLHDQLGRKFYQIGPLLGKTELLLRRGEVDAAAQALQQATALAMRISNRTYLLECDRWQARLYAAQGLPDEAAELLQSVLQREFRPDVRASLEQELAGLKGAAWRAGQPRLQPP